MPEQAELVWARYDSGTQSKFYLLVYLGECDDHTVALIADRVPEIEIDFLRSRLAQLRNMDLQKVGNLIKDNMPISWKGAYRNFKTEKLTIIRQYGLKAMEEPKP